MRVVDVPATASAVQAEELINAPCEDGYYSYYQMATGLPEGVGVRFFYKLRANSEH